MKYPAIATGYTIIFGIYFGVWLGMDKTYYKCYHTRLAMTNEEENQCTAIMQKTKKNSRQEWVNS